MGESSTGITNVLNSITHPYLSNALSAFDAFQTDNKQSWTDVQAKLSENEAAVEFIQYPLEIGNDHSPLAYSALIVKKDSKQPELVPLCLEEDLEKIAGQNPQQIRHIESLEFLLPEWQ